jgi:hypothetical protein
MFLEFLDSRVSKSRPGAPEVGTKSSGQRPSSPKNMQGLVSRRSLSTLCGGAGWHKAHSLTVPAKMKLRPLPRRSPELNPAEHVLE